MIDFYVKLAFHEARQLALYREQAAKWNSGVKVKAPRFRREAREWAQQYWRDALRSEDRIALCADRIIRQLMWEKDK